MPREDPAPPVPTAPETGSIPVMLAPGAVLPARAHDGDAGLDLCAAEDVQIPPLGRALVTTGVSLALAPGTAGLVCPRSGLAARHGITVLNGPGIVDAGYRGEIRVPLHNTDPEHGFAVHVGDRIAQLVVVPVCTPPLHAVPALDESARGAAGFGSTGGFGTDLPPTREG